MGARPERFGENFTGPPGIDRGVRVLFYCKIAVTGDAACDDAVTLLVVDHDALATDRLREGFLQPGGIDPAGDADEGFPREVALVGAGVEGEEELGVMYRGF